MKKSQLPAVECLVNVDLEQAARYLEALTGSRETPVTWCMLKEQNGGKPPVSLYGTLEQHAARIAALNAGGCGVFIAVNVVKPGARRTRENVTAVRALFVDCDHGALGDEALAPTFRVKSARGEHAYWVLTPGELLDRFDSAQKQLAAFYGSDPAVCDLPRLMRVPGFLHRRAEPLLVRFIAGDEQMHSIDEVLRAHPVPPEKLRDIEGRRPRAEATPRHAILPSELPSMRMRKARAESYLRRMAPAVEGERGDARTFKVACVVVRDFAVDNFADAMDVLRGWNSGCSPPWEERDLATKIRSALRNGQGVFGSKLAPGTGQHADPVNNCDVANGDAETAPVPFAAVAPPGIEDEANSTDIAAGGLEGFAENEDQPFSMQLVTMLAQDPTLLLRPAVIATIERLQHEDPAEFTRCLFEIKASGAGMVNDVKKAVRRRREERKADEAKRREAQDVFVVNVLPAAKAVVQGDHRLPFGYDLAWNGVAKLCVKQREDGETTVEVPVCDRPVLIRSAIDKIDGSGTFLELAFRTRDNGDWTTITAARDVAMTSRLLTGLALQRFPVHSGNASLLVEYLARYEAANEKVIQRKKAAVQMGWQGDDGKLGFLVGKQHIAPAKYEGEPLQFSAGSEGDDLLAESFRQGGSEIAWFDAWQAVTKYPRVQLGVLASLSAPLLQLLHLDNFFVDYSGETSGGKTTTLQIAASVWGPPSGPKHSIMRSWNTTVAGMERAASTVTGLPLFIDESNEAQTPLERQAMAKMIYQLANGRGRTRAMRTNGTQPLRHWSTVVLSSGEHPIVNATQDAGTRARILSLQDSPFGGVTDETSKDVSELKNTVTHNHGHAGPRFVQWVMNHATELPGWVRRHQELARTYELDPRVPKGVGERLARHLALLDLTGELMNDAFGLLGYESPVRECLSTVMESAQDADKPKAALIEVVTQALMQRARFAGEANHDPMMGYIGKRTMQCADEACMALTPAFVREALSSAGYNYHAITRSWSTRGYVVRDGAGKTQRFCKIDGASVRCYCIKWCAIEFYMSAS